MSSSCTVAMVSDTHGYLDPRIVRVARHCDYVLHAGDIGCAAVLAALQPRRGEVIAVLGNNDRPDKWPAQDRAILPSLSEDAELRLPGGVLVMVHGHRVMPAKRRHTRLRSMFPYARAIVYGHSHRMCEDRSAMPWVLNPGAAGRARTFGGPSCMVLHASRREWRVQSLRFPSEGSNHRPRSESEARGVP